MGNPVVLEAVKIEVVGSADIKARYKHGITGLNVFGYVSFTHDGFWEAPQYINFDKTIISPRIPRPEFFKWQCKPDLTLKITPVYGSFDPLEILANNLPINLLAGETAGLATRLANGALGLAPLVVTNP